MGSSGNGAIERTLLGSNTSFVVTHSACDLLVVKDEKQADGLSIIRDCGIK